MKTLIGSALVGMALVVAFIVSGPGVGRAQEQVTITGTVVNGTQGEAEPEGAPVLLLVTGADGALLATSQTASGAGGGFQFEGVPSAVGGSYTFSVDYASVFYREAFGLEDLAGEIRLTVYEPTQDNSVITVTNQVMIITGIDTGDRLVSAVEFVRLSNTSDRTLLPDLANPQLLSFLRFALPPMAEALDVGTDLPGGDIVSIGTGFALTSPVMPGDHSVDFSFWFPYEGSAVSYRQSLPQGAEVYRVMAPPQLDALRVAPLESLPNVDVEGVSYRAWEAREVRPGQGLQLELTNLPQPSLAQRLGRSISDGSFWQIAIPCALGAVLAFLLFWGSLGRQRRESLASRILPRRRPARAEADHGE